MVDHLLLRWWYNKSKKKMKNIITEKNKTCNKKCTCRKEGKMQKKMKKKYIITEGSATRLEKKNFCI